MAQRSAARVLINYNKIQLAQNMKHIKIRAFACEHEESVIYGTAVEYKMHRPTAENYSRSIHITYVLRDDTEYAYVILSTYI